jgi:NAD(P)-dependent dehydrogenase (short-subunit alcohol dehydrogenase family)
MSPIALTGLEDKIVVVTGAGRMRSIGRKIAVEFARGGCDVVITGTGRPPERYPDDEKEAGWRDIESVADEIRELGRRALPLVSNVADHDAVQALHDRVIEEFGRVDFVINNAAAARGADRAPAVDVDFDVWEHVIQVNLNGTFYMSKIFGQRLIEQGTGGAIINISSVAGKRFSENSGAYAASKAGIHALTACMAREVGCYNVRVNSVCPGTVDTSRMDDIPRGEVWEQRVSAKTPLGRASNGDDIASITAFLCSEQGAWIHGQSINVDGGAVMEH